MSSKEILVVTLSSDEDESKDESTAPTPSSGPSHIQTRQSERKRSGRISTPKFITPDLDDNSDDNGNGRDDTEWSNHNKKGRAKEDPDEDYTPSYDNVPATCDKDLPALPEHLINRNRKGQMYCPVCSAIFKKWTDFTLHRRRHAAPDHLMCTTCQKGFVKLKDCLDHEFELHHNQNFDVQSKNGVRYSNLGKSRGTEKWQQEIIPSTCLYAYRGPPIRDMHEPYQIDYQYTRPEKKANTRHKSKLTLDIHKEIQANTEALIEEALHNQESQGPEKEKVIVSRSTSNPSDHSSRKDKNTKQKVVDHGKKSGLKLKPQGKYRCKKCAYFSRKRKNVEAHIDDKHPSIPDGRFKEYIVYDPTTEERSKEPSGYGSTEKVTAGSTRESRPVVAASFNNISQGVCTSPPKQQLPKTKKKSSRKKKITFGKRLDALRVWEKTKEPLTKSEFLSALSLIHNSDVLLGPRQGLRRIESSLFGFRRVHREKSPPPHARIVLEKLPIEYARHNHVFLCNICDFVSPSDKDIRNHRRNEHLKNQDITAPETGSHSKKAPKSNLVPSLPSTSARESLSSAPVAVPPASLIHDLPNENVNSPLYKCGRCEFKSDDRREVKSHRQIVHKGTGAGSGYESSSSSVNSAAVQERPPVKANTTPDRSTEVIQVIEYRCDKCLFASCIRDEVKQHRKDVHKKNITLVPAQPPSTGGLTQQRLKDFTKPIGPAKKKFKPN